jgi:hypothetical protein
LMASTEVVMPRGKRESTAEVWGERVRRWRASGLPAAQFAKQEGIGRPQALSWWAWKLSTQARDKPRKASAGKRARPQLRLVQLNREALVAPCSAGAEEPVEIITASGTRVMVSSRASAAAVLCALRALGVCS